MGVATHRFCWAVSWLSIRVRDDRDITYAITGTSENAIDGDGAITYTGTGFNYDDTAALEADGWTLSTNGEPHTRTLSVTATSGDNSTDSVTQSVTINLTNEIELAFIFDTGERAYTGSLAENLDGQTDAVDIVAVEAVASDDASRSVTYALDDASETLGFRIDADTGAITYEGEALDYDTATERSFALPSQRPAGR